ncbi:MAG: hypothetical protein M3037_03060 [Gemmatimonadota bacterium]|nr:hypothetical protein [Gemmatimonadota bacterium]
MSRKAVCRGGSDEGGTGPLIPVIVVFVARADAGTSSAAEYRLSVSRKASIEFLGSDFTEKGRQVSYR